MKMTYLNNQKKHARQLLGLAVGTVMLTGLFPINSYSAIRARFSGVAKTNGAPIPLNRPQPSPDSRTNGKIAFTSDRDGNQEIYVMNNDGTGQTRLTNNPGVDNYPSFSPDGRKIAFISESASGAFAITLMNADGTNQTRLTPIVPDTDPYPWQGKRSLSWSPDGSKIAFDEKHDIFTINIDGSNLVNLTNHPALDIEPSWSPDGSRIMFISSRVFYLTMHIMNADGSDVRALPSDEELWDMSPDWSPTGDKIAFIVHSEVHIPIVYIANADGTNRQPFDGSGSGSAHRNKPRWSPDATKIVFNIWDYFSNDSEIYVKNANGGGLTQLTNTNGNNFQPSWGPEPAAPSLCPNPIDCADSFVRQHYRDFLNREPDTSGLAYWTNEITQCGTDSNCIEAHRVSVSAAFFLSIEFQETGYLVYRTYKAAYGNLPDAPVPIKLNEFLPDTQQIGQGVIVNQAGWEQLLENNKQNFFSGFVQRSRFTSAYPTSLTPDQFVDQLFFNAGVTPSATDRAAATNEFDGAMTTGDVAARARALRRVTEDSTLAQQEFNRAFVLIQYFGYLRRNPNDLPDINCDGYNFWLTKLNQFNGDFRTAEMVKAFLVSTEYRQRFGQP
jgi:Tol biopolymer transport system component